MPKAYVKPADLHLSPLRDSHSGEPLTGPHGPDPVVNSGAKDDEPPRLVRERRFSWLSAPGSSPAVNSGFGRQLAEQLLARGDRVFATLRKVGALDDLQAAYGDRLRVATLDVTDTAAVRRVVDEAFAAFGRIDVVVSNAGYGLFGAAEELTRRRRSATSSTPTSSARSSSRAPRCRTCARRAAAASCSCRRWAGRSRIRR